ncbi:MAG: bifunctional precorrin-2 dehydrogenase/sirohydrochlorin ferrochelatase [Kiritimatiellae bacterium]|nr:bifunctional precorrin-2 dehydrogenase/sirohydrochlorin ferrochelatase [Kiritimatiellia bacterium]
MHFPLFVDLAGRECLVVGAGKIAARKAKTLESFGARVKTVAPETAGRGFEESDVEGMALVVAATDDHGLNARVSAICRARGIPVNAVDDPANCTFFFPAIARNGPVTAAVSTGGACPAAAAILRDRIAGLMDDGFAAKVEKLGGERERLKKEFPDPEERRRHCEEELNGRP